MAETLIIKIDISLRRDERGFVCFPFDDDALLRGGYYNVHIPSMNPGTVRGNHYHPGKKEYVVILGGNCRVIAEGPGNQKPGRKLYFEDQPEWMLVFPANVAHAIKNEGDKALYLLCYNRREEGEEGRPETQTGGDT